MSILCNCNKVDSAVTEQGGKFARWVMAHCRDEGTTRFFRQRIAGGSVQTQEGDVRCGTMVTKIVELTARRRPCWRSLGLNLRHLQCATVRGMGPADFAEMAVAAV